MSDPRFGDWALLLGAARGKINGGNLLMSIAPGSQQQIGVEQQPGLSVRSLFEAGPPPMAARCIAAIRRDLPDMLRSHRGWWVAYHGDTRIGFGRTKTELYEACLRRGLAPDEFIVCGVEDGTYAPDAEFDATLHA